MQYFILDGQVNNKKICTIEQELFMEGLEGKIVTKAAFGRFNNLESFTSGCFYVITCFNEALFYPKFKNLIRHKMIWISWIILNLLRSLLNRLNWFTIRFLYTVLIEK
jgi:hypothetical protein